MTGVVLLTRSSADSPELQLALTEGVLVYLMSRVAIRDQNLGFGEGFCIEGNTVKIKYLVRKVQCMPRLRGGSRTLCRVDLSKFLHVGSRDRCDTGAICDLIQTFNKVIITHNMRLFDDRKKGNPPCGP